MLAVVELRRIASSLKVEGFERQLGPFVLVQRPPDRLTQQKAMQLGAKRTVALKRGADSDDMSLLFEFDDLIVATLPPVEAGELTVGRMPDCELMVEDPSVSKHHANLGWDASRQVAWVEDLGSSNGTWLNGDKLHVRMTVRDGDTLSFGDTHFALLHTRTLFSRLTTGKFKGA